MVEAATKVKRDALQALPDAASWNAEQVLRWGVDTYGRKVALSSSFQADGMVVLDISRRLGLDLRVITVDTGRLPPETHELIDEVRERYGVEIETQFPDQAELSDLVTKFGTNPFYRSVSLRLMCCETRKSHPVDAALGELDAWIAANRMGSTDAYQSFLESTRTAPSPRMRSRCRPTRSKASPRPPAVPRLPWWLGVSVGGVSGVGSALTNSGGTIVLLFSSGKISAKERSSPQSGLCSSS